MWRNNSVLPEKTRIQFPASMSGVSQQPETPAPGDWDALFWPLQDREWWRWTKQSSREHCWTVIHLPQTPRPTYPLIWNSLKITERLVYKVSSGIVGATCKDLISGQDSFIPALNEE